MDTPINQPVVRDRCPPPKSVADTEIELNSLLRLLLKTVYVRGLESASQLSFALKLPLSVVNELLEEAKERGVLEVLGSAGHRFAAEFRYGITERGRQWATDALDQVTTNMPSSAMETEDSRWLNSVVWLTWDSGPKALPLAA